MRSVGTTFRTQRYRELSRGIYDVGRNAGFVNVGTDHDTAAFAVASIRGWWRSEGRRLYSTAERLLITADGGGSNGSRLRLWKLEWQELADETELSLSVCHFPPGTSKWNKIEHRLFSFISSNWRGEPLRDYETIVHLIARTTTAKGLRVTCRLDRRKYPTGRKVSDEEMKSVNIRPSHFHGGGTTLSNHVEHNQDATFISLRSLSAERGVRSAEWGVPNHG